MAVRERRKARPVRIPAAKLTTDALAVATDPRIDIVCELIGGTGLARQVTLAALKRGKIVISANKALICECGAEIFACARRHGGHFLFEASVAGGIPIIKALREGLVANRFPRIYGILNGTCNYILTQMEALGAPYARVLAEAKALGYAEADESLDVEGWDTAHKASILAWLAHGIWVRTDQMIVEGIDRITPADLQNAATLGYGIKLLAVITRDFQTDEISVRVHPTLLPVRSVIASVERRLQRDRRDGRRGRHDALHRPRRRPGCHRQRGDQRHRRRGGPAAPRPGRACRRDAAGPPPSAARSPRRSASAAATTCASRSTTSPGCWPAWPPRWRATA